MFDAFMRSLADNLADILTLALIVVVAAGIIYYALARRRHVVAIRKRLGGQVTVPSKVEEVLRHALNADVAEAGAIGAVTFVDLAWQYSMADPSIWEHFNGPAADHITDALQNLDVLKAALGDHALPLVDNVIEWLKGLEALHVFSDVADKLPLLGDAPAIVLDTKGGSLVDSLIGAASTAHTAAEAKAAAASSAWNIHLPLVTIGFASYRAWRRAQKGAGWGRNLEFAAIEVGTRATGGLIGGKVGGVIGTAIVPGVGTILGAVVGAVGGAIGGALLGESIKKRHVEKASRDLNAALERLGAAYLNDSENFERLTGVFRAREEDYLRNLRDLKRRLRRYALPWRLVWPDEKLVLLQETVRLAERRLGTVREGTVAALDKLAYMRESGQCRELGTLLLSNPALCEAVPCDAELVGAARQANERLRRELQHMGMLAEGAAA